MINALYDGLTDDRRHRPGQPGDRAPRGRVLRGQRGRHGVDVHDPKDDQFSSDGEQVLPSSFQRAWDRAAQPDFAGDYSYLIGPSSTAATQKLDGEADTISGIVADDEAMTLEVTLDRARTPTSTPSPASSCSSRCRPRWTSWRTRTTGRTAIMIGNGPYLMAEPRTDEEIVLDQQRRLVGRLQRRHLDGPSGHDHLPGDRRPRHLVQRVRGRRGRQRQHPAGPHGRGAEATYGTTLDVTSWARTTTTSTSATRARRRRREPPVPPGHQPGHRP